MSGRKLIKGTQSNKTKNPFQNKTQVYVEGFSFMCDQAFEHFTTYRINTPNT